MPEAPNTEAVETAEDRVKDALLALWTKAGKSSSYVKSEWVELEAAIDSLRDADTRAATDWLRTETTALLDGLPKLLRDLAEIARVVALNNEGKRAEARASQAEELDEAIRSRLGPVTG